MADRGVEIDLAEPFVHLIGDPGLCLQRVIEQGGRAAAIARFQHPVPLEAPFRVQGRGAIEGLGLPAAGEAVLDET